jgi:hypothetical protein
MVSNGQLIGKKGVVGMMNISIALGVYFIINGWSFGTFGIMFIEFDNHEYNFCPKILTEFSNERKRKDEATNY